MSSSYGSYYQDKGAYAPRPATGSSTASSNYAQSAYSSRSRGFGGRPQTTVVVHKPSGPLHDPNTSSSVGNSGYYK